MKRASQGVSIEVLREAVRRRVADSTLRQVAAEIGMSFSGLHTFLDGTTPHPGTVRKVAAWHVRAASESGNTVDTALAETALDLLLRHVPPRKRPALRRELVEALVAQAKREQLPPPAWADALLKATSTGTTPVVEAPGKASKARKAPVKGPKPRPRSK